MKRIFVIGVCAVLMASSYAKELEVIDLGGESTPEQQEKGRQFMAAQDAAAKIPAVDARSFIRRLDSSVEKSLLQAQSGTMDAVKVRNQAIHLAALQKEGDKFGVLFAPFAKCRQAAVDAAMAWQGLIGRDEKQFVEYHKSYQGASAACHAAAK